MDLLAGNTAKWAVSFGADEGECRFPREHIKPVLGSRLINIAQTRLVAGSSLPKWRAAATTDWGGRAFRKAIFCFMGIIGMRAALKRLYRDGRVARAPRFAVAKDVVEPNLHLPRP